MELSITLRNGRTNVRTLAVSHRVLAFKACSARPASKHSTMVEGSSLDARSRNAATLSL